MIDLSNIQVRFGQATVLEDVSLQIDQGETVAVVGESGAGKTTMAHVLLGLVAPSSGSYSFDDLDVRTLRGPQLRAWRRRIQTVLQNPTASLNPRVRIEVAVTEPLTAARRMGRAEVRTTAERLLDDVGLDTALAGRYPGQLSGGQRQRVVIARALGADPDLLLLDEPVSALDASARAQVLNLLADVRARTGVTTIYITHDLATVGYLCDRVIVFFGGMVMEDLPIDQLHTSPDNPYTRELRAASMPAQGASDPAEEDGPSGPVASRAPATGAGTERGCPFSSQCPIAEDVCRTSRPPLVQLGERWWSRCHFAGSKPSPHSRLRGGSQQTPNEEARRDA